MLVNLPISYNCNARALMGRLFLILAHNKAFITTASAGKS